MNKAFIAHDGRKTLFAKDGRRITHIRSSADDRTHGNQRQRTDVHAEQQEAVQASASIGDVGAEGATLDRGKDVATLIGRDVWHAGAVLSFGRVVKRNELSNSVTIDRGIGWGELIVHSSQILLTKEAALREAEERVDYWQCEARKLEQMP